MNTLSPNVAKLMNILEKRINGKIKNSETCDSLTAIFEKIKKDNPQDYIKITECLQRTMRNHNFIQ